MGEEINEQQYREFIQSVYVWEIDNNPAERKKYADKISSEYLQKIINDSYAFLKTVVEDLKKEQDNLIDSVFAEYEIRQDNSIGTNLHGGWWSDELYNPVDYPEDFYVSRHIIQAYLGEQISYDDKEFEYYNEEEEAGSIIYVPYLHISMNKDKFKELLKIINKDKKILSKINRQQQ